MDRREADSVAQENKEEKALTNILAEHILREKKL